MPTRLKSVRVGLGLLVLLIAATVAHAGDWPQWLGPNRNGTSPESVAPWKGELKVLWQQPTGEGHSSPVVAQGIVVTHGRVKGKDSEEVVAFAAQDGKEIWRKSYERGPFTNMFGNGPRSTPSIDGDRVYTLGVTGILTCWNLKDGQELWRKDLLKEYSAKNLFFGVSTTPLIVDDTVIVMVGGEKGGVVALDKKSGAQKWVAGTDKASYSSPVLTKIGDRNVIIVLTQQGVAALNAEDGKEYWKSPLVDKLMESSATPVRVGDVLWASSVTFGSVALKLGSKDGMPTQEQLWKSPQLTSYFATPVAVGEQLYLVTGSIVTRSAVLNCVDLKTGNVLWSKKGVGKDHATVLLAKDKLLMLEEKGDLVLIQPDSKEYKELARAKACGFSWAHPALSNGKLYVRDDKEVRCLELSGDAR